jgi:hypothetical protein
MLEVVRNHEYGRSRFLRGAELDEAKIPDADEARAEASPVRYLNPERLVVHFLDRPLSFDDDGKSNSCGTRRVSPSGAPRKRVCGR